MKRAFESLRKGKDIKIALTQGRRYSNMHMRAAIIKNDTGKIRLGIVTSKKLGGAVTRNRIRRRIKEAFIAETRNINSAKCADIVIFPYMTTKNAGFIEIRTGICDLLSVTRLS